MTPRDTVIEAMARAMCDAFWGGPAWDIQAQHSRKNWIKRAISALDALLATLPALGLRVVPSVATDEMQIGIEGDWPSPSIHFDFEQDDCKSASSCIYAAMLAAAPDVLTDA